MLGKNHGLLQINKYYLLPGTELALTEAGNSVLTASVFQS